MDVADADAEGTYTLQIAFSNAADAVRRLNVTLHFETLTTIYDYDEFGCDFECVSKETSIPFPASCYQLEDMTTCTYSCTDGQEGDFEYHYSNCSTSDHGYPSDYAPIDAEACTLLEIITPTVPEAFEMTLNESEE